jgi:hypothetical protein
MDSVNGITHLNRVASTPRDRRENRQEDGKFDAEFERHRGSDAKQDEQKRSEPAPAAPRRSPPPPEREHGVPGMHIDVLA